MGKGQPTPLHQPVRKVTYREIKGGSRTLQNSIIFEPAIETLRGERMRLYTSTLDEIFGPQWRQQVKDKTVVIPYSDLGWGHRFQAWALGHFMSQLGVRTMVVDSVEIAGIEASHHARMKTEFYERAQRNEPLEMNRMIRYNLQHIVGDMAAALIYGIANVRLQQKGGQQTEKTFLTKVFAPIFNLIERSYRLTNLAYRSSVKIDTALADAPFRKKLVDFLEAVGADAVVCTYSSPARALIGTPYESKTILTLPDPGYHRSPEMMLPLAAISNRILFGTADRESARMLNDHYGIPKTHIFSVGTIADLVEPDEVLEKWRSTQRNILISTSGNPVHIEIITQAIRDFAPELKRDDTPYKLVVFLGEHPDEKVAPVLQAVEEQGLTGNSNLKIVRTANPMDTAQAKWYWKRQCHVEIAKPGENPMDAPQLGTFFIGLPATSPHEEENLRVACQWGSAVPSCWPETSYQYWSKKEGFKKFEAPGFEQPQTSLVEYLNYLFGNNVEHKNFAQIGVENGIDNTPHNAAFLYTALALSRLLLPNQPETLKKIREKIEMFGS